MSDDYVIRYVITNIGTDGLRTLTFPQQGRYTYETREEAQEALELFKPDLRNKILGMRADTLEVRSCECWPGHFDPKGVYFSTKREGRHA